MDLTELSALIGIDLTPDASECTIFNNAISSILCQHWRNANMFCDDFSVIPENPAFIIDSTLKIINTRFYFDVDAYDPNFATLDYIINALDAALYDIQGIEDVIPQGNRVLVCGANQKVFSLTFFEMSEQWNSDLERNTKTWVMNTSFNGL